MTNTFLNTQTEPQNITGPKHAVLLAFKHFAAYRFSGDEARLNKAVFIVVKAREKYAHFRALNFMAIFLDCAARRYGKAEDEKNAIEQNKHFLKQNEPRDYAIFLFLSFVCAIGLSNEKQAEKRLKALAESQAATPIANVLLGFAHILKESYQTAYDCFCEAYKAETYTFFCRMGFYALFAEKIRVKDTKGVFTPFLLWSVRKGVIINDCVEYYTASIVAANETNIANLEKIYAVYKVRVFLEAICAYYIKRRDYSEKARVFYKEAQDKQLTLPDLDDRLITASFINNNEAISRFAMTNFLNKPVADHNLASFVYCLLVSDEKHADAARKHRNEILAYAFKAAKNGDRGRCFNAVYAYYLTEMDAAANSGETGDGFFDGAGAVLSDGEKTALEDILYDNLFYYEAALGGNAVQVWVFDKEKSSRAVFSADGKQALNKKIRVKTVSKRLRYLCFNESNRAVTPKKLPFLKCLPFGDEAMCEYFVKSRPDDCDINIVLARYYAETNQNGERCVSALNKALAQNNISKHFRTHTAAYLGSALAARFKIDRAAQYYADVDCNLLSDNYLEQMLAVLLAAGETEKAAALISKKAHCISDRGLYNALTKLAANPKYHLIIANAAYELILKSWYDKNLVDIVINNYNGGQADLEALGEALFSLAASDFRLDKRILENCVYMRALNKASQRVFVRMYKILPDAEIIGDFIYYMCFEMLSRDKKIESAARETLEWHYSFTKDKLLGYALTHFYLTYNVTTANSAEIINGALSQMERDGFILPCVEKIKDTARLAPYIIKNTPFIYRGLPGKNVYLNFYPVSNRENAPADAAPPYRVKMKYFAFGMYLCALPHFYNEELEFYFSEESERGSVQTGPENIKNARSLLSQNEDDAFFAVNNALIYEQMFRYDEVEKIISSLLKPAGGVIGKIL